MSGNKLSKRPLRILHIVRNLEVGGMEGRVARLARGLNPEQFQISIMGLRPLAGRQVELPPHVPYLTEAIAPGLHLSALWRLSRRLKAGHYDLVHTHNWPTMFYGILAAKLARVPVVFHGEHGLESAQHVPKKRWLAQRALAALTRRVVAVNSSIGKAVQTGWSLRGSKVVVLPNGVDVNRFQPRHADIPSEFVIGTVGRQVPVKDLPCLIRAFAQFREIIKQKTPTNTQVTRLLLVGDGPETEKLKALARELEVLPHCEFAGDAQNPEVFYARMDVYANTSVYEGMSNTLLEALACGLPLVASDVAGNRDWLVSPDNADFFTCGDSEALAHIFWTLFNEGARRQWMGQNNRRRALAEFDNQQFLKRYAALYFEVLGVGS